MFCAQHAPAGLVNLKAKKMCRHVGGSVAASYGMEGRKQADFGSERYKNRLVATFAGTRKRQTRTRRSTRKEMVPDVGSRKRCTSRGCTGVPTHGFRSSTSKTARFCAKHASNEWSTSLKR
ncbi:unnamed protein product [Ectocarpus sp. 8 AP-2014]